MGVSGGPNIIRDSSLVLELDAADRNSYPGSGTTWRDLTANNNSGSLVNGPTFNSANLGSIVFDGTNDYVSIPASMSLSSHTFISWVYFNSLNKDWIPIAEFQSGGSTRAHYYVQGDLNPSQIRGFGANWTPNSITDNSTWGSSNLTTVQPNKWYMLTGRLDGSLGDTYINTEKSKATKTGISYNNVGTTDILNARIGSSFYNSGIVGSILVYSRALSDAEILQNYSALKSRFNL
jgi:hypothetical protein